MSASHTPGPWIVSDGDTYIENMAQCLLADKGTDREWTAVGIADKEGYAESVAYCHPANARVIAAAPELLACLEKIQGISSICLHAKGGPSRKELLGMSTLALTLARAAIKQAEGTP